MNTVIKSSDPCPRCLLMNNEVHQLSNRPGQFYTVCTSPAAHKFEDTEELNVLRQQARAKFPSLYKGGDAAPTDMAVFANQDIVITAQMKKDIEELTGVQFTGAADLKGAIFAFTQDNKDKDAEIRHLRTQLAAAQRGARAGGNTGAVNPGDVVVSIPEWAQEGVNSQAEHAGMVPNDWVSQEFGAWMESYFGVGPGQKIGGRG